MPLELTDGDRSASGTARIRSGERKYLSLAYSTEAPAVVPLLGEGARGRIERTVRWWQEWANRCTYEGPYRDAVVRSAFALKLMTYAPSGAVVAAPTTSLPEAIGGVRNWDYRYCWLRDASFTLRALFDLGYGEEAEAYLSWMLHATRLTWPELQVLYDVFGEAKLPERELPHLAGYAGSRPVRDRQRCAGPAPARRLRRGDRRVPPVRWTAAGASTATRPHARRSRADGLPALARAGRGDLGGAFRPLPSHPLEGAVLGRAGPADRAARSRASRASRRPRFAPNGTRFGRRSRRTGTTSGSAATPAPSTATSWMQAC